MHLVCANAEALPFPDGVFSRVYSLGMVEHCSDVDAVAKEARRGLGPRGRLRFRTVNRYSLLREPHVGVWGVGYLPRRWQSRYVRWRSGRGYEQHHPWSVSELSCALRRAGFSDVSVAAASTLPSELVGAGTGMRLLAPLYQIARRLPILRRGVTQIAPILEIVGVVS